MNSRAPAPRINAFALGDSGFALLGIGLAVEPDPVTGDLAINVIAVGGRQSELVTLSLTPPLQVPLVEIARIPQADVARALAEKEQKLAADALADMPRAQG